MARPLRIEYEKAFYHITARGKVFVYLARSYTDNKLSRISEFLYNRVTPVAISKLFSRTEEELVKQKDLRRDIEKIEKILFAFR